MRVKNTILIISSISIVLITAIWFTPYIKNLRQHYSFILETKGDNLSEDKQRALSNYIFAKYLYPNDNIRYKIGSIYLDKGNEAVAEREFKIIKQGDIKVRISTDYLRIAEVQKAEAYLSTLSATDEVLYNKLLISLFSSNIQSECFSNNFKCNQLRNKSTAIVDNKNDTYKNTAIAELLYKEGFVEMALKKLESKEFKDYRDYYYLLGRIYSEKGLYNKSATALEKSITLDPHYLPSYELLLTTYNKIGETKKANELITIINKLSTSNIKF